MEQSNWKTKYQISSIKHIFILKCNVIIRKLNVTWKEMSFNKYLVVNILFVMRHKTTRLTEHPVNKNDDKNNSP